MSKATWQDFPYKVVGNSVSFSMTNECKMPHVQGLAEVRPTETPVVDMKKRADLAIRDDDYGSEGWAQMKPRANKGFPEVVKQFLREQFLRGD